MLQTYDSVSPQRSLRPAALRLRIVAALWLAWCVVYRAHATAPRRLEFGVGKFARRHGGRRVRHSLRHSAHHGPRRRDGHARHRRPRLRRDAAVAASSQASRSPCIERTAWGFPPTRFFPWRCGRSWPAWSATRVLCGRVLAELSTRVAQRVDHRDAQYDARRAGRLRRIARCARSRCCLRGSTSCRRWRWPTGAPGMMLGLALGASAAFATAAATATRAARGGP